MRDCAYKYSDELPETNRLLARTENATRKAFFLHSVEKRVTLPLRDGHPACGVGGQVRAERPSPLSSRTRRDGQLMAYVGYRTRRIHTYTHTHR